MNNEVELRDGSRVEIRELTADDKERLGRTWNRLSPESRYRRFLSPPSDPSDSTLTYLTDVDQRDHVALAAAQLDTNEVDGVARFVRDPERAHTADVAVAVVDDRQGLGVGSALLSRLLDRALEEGIACFTAEVLVDNQESIDVLGHLGPITVTGTGAGVKSLRIDLSEPERGLREAMRAAAGGLMQGVRGGFARLG